MPGAAYGESAFTLDTGDGHKIYGIHNTAAPGINSDKAIVISHGLTGNPNQYLFKQAQRFFNAKGYDTIRFAYYDSLRNARKLKNCTLALHANDLNTVCEHFRAQYRKLFIAGHSYGGLTILFANPKVDAISFWDSSFQPYPSLWKTESEYLQTLDMYVLHWASDHLIGKAMVEEARALTANDATALAKRITIPSQVAIAGGDPRRQSRLGLYDALTCEKEMREIPDADHIFSTKETAFDLLEVTQGWFSRF